MPEQKISYQERLDMKAHSLFLLVDNYTDAYVSKHDPLIQSKARDDIAAQAEAIRNALQPIVSDSYIENYLNDYGYIEPKNEINRL